MDNQPNKYIILNKNQIKISDVINDCTGFCVPVGKGEPLSSILKKICAKIEEIQCQTPDELDPIFTASPAFSISYNDISQWGVAYNKSITSIDFSGDVTKTLTIHLQDGSTLTASFNDIAGSEAFIDGVSNTPTITLSVHSGILSANVIVGSVDNTQQNLVVWDGSALKLREVSSMATRDDLSNSVSALSNSISLEAATRSSEDAALSIRIDNISTGGGSGSVASADHVSLANQVSALSSQLSTEIASRIAADSATSTHIDTLSNSISALSSDINTVSNSLSVETAARILADDGLSAANLSLVNRVSGNSADFTSFKQSINNFGDTSLDGAIGGQVIMYNSATGEWVASAVAVGTGSVTSNKMSVAIAVETSNRTSADDALSNSISALSTIVSNQGSAIIANSTQMTSADAALSTRIETVSAANASTWSTVSTLKYAAVEIVSTAAYTLSAGDHLKTKYFTTAVPISVTLPDGLASGFNCIIFRAQGAGAITLSATTSVETQGLSLNYEKTGATILNRGSDLWVAMGAFGSTQVVSVTSAEYTSLVDRVSSNSATLSNVQSVVAANSAQMTSADNAISNTLSVETINRISGDNALSNLISALSVVVSNQGSAIIANSADVTSLKDRVSANSAVLSNSLSAIAANSAQMVSADNAISNAVSVLSVQLSLQVSALSQKISVLSQGLSANSVVLSNTRSAVVANSAQMTSADNQALSLISVLSATVSNVNSAVQANSADVTSVKNVISIHSQAISVLSQQVSALSQNLSANSVVLSNAVSAIQANSADVTSIKNVISVHSQAISVLSQQISVVSNAVSIVSVAAASKNPIITIVDEGVSLLSSPTIIDFVGTGVQVSVSGTRVTVSVGAQAATTSTDVTSNHLSQLSQAISVHSQQISVLSQQVSALSQNLSANSVVLSNAVSAIVVNSAQMTSADNAISNAVSVVSVAAAAVSADLTSVKNVVSVHSQAISVLSQQVSVLSQNLSANSVVLSNAVSAIVANSADVTSLKNVVSNLSVQLSLQVSALSQSLSSQAAALSVRIDTQSNAISGISAKTEIHAVRLVQTTNVTPLTSVTSVVDGISAATGDRILLAGQTSTQFNGVYIWAGGGYTRAADMNNTSAWNQQVPGRVLQVTEGTANAGKFFVVSAPFGGTIDTTSIAINGPYTNIDGVSAINAVSNAVSALSVQLSLQVSALSQVHSALSANVATISLNVSAISTRLDTVSNNLSQNSVVLSNTVSAVAANSADVTSLKNVVSNLSVQLSLQVSALSQVHSALSANVATISLNVSAISTRLSALSTQVTNLSAQVTSADNAISNAVSVLSTQLSLQVSALSQVHSALSANVATMSLNLSAVSTRLDTVSNNLSQNSVVLSNTVSAVVANSADVTSLKNVVSNLSVQLSLQVSALSQAISALQIIQLQNLDSVAVSAGSPVYLFTSANTFKRGGEEGAYPFRDIIGLVQDGSIAISAIGNVRIAGILSLTSTQWDARTGDVGGLVAGSRYWLGASAGTITKSAFATYMRNIGTALDSNRLALQLGGDDPLQSFIDLQSDLISVKAAGLNNIADVSIDGVTDGQVLMFHSATGEWIASTITAGAGSVTSTELSAAVAVETSNRVSADNALSNSISALSVVVSNQGSAIAANSADVTSIKNVISIHSQAISVLSQQISVLSQNLSANSVILSNHGSAIAANSAQMVSLVSALSVQLSLQVSALSQKISVLSQGLSANSVVLSNAVSAIVANSAQMTSADNQALSLISVLSAAHTSLVGHVVTLSNKVSGQSTTIATNSAQMTSADNAISAAQASTASVVSIMKFVDVEIVSTAAYTLSAGDHLKFKFFTTATPISVTLPNGLTSGFNCIIYRGAGAGSITLSATTSVEAQGLILGSEKTGVQVLNRGTDLWVAMGALATGGTGAGSVTSAELVDGLSALSANVSIIASALSQQISALSVVVSNQGSAIAANSADVTSLKNLTQSKVIAGAQSVSAAALTKISGLSASVVAAGIYQLDGFLMFQGSAMSVYGFGLSMQTGTMADAAGQWRGNTQVGMVAISNQVSTGIYGEAAGYWNQAGFGSVTYSLAVSTPAGANAMVALKGVVAMSTTGGTIQLKAKSGGSGVVTIKAGSYFRAYRIG